MEGVDKRTPSKDDREGDGIAVDFNNLSIDQRLSQSPEIVSREKRSLAANLTIEGSPFPIPPKRRDHSSTPAVLRSEPLPQLVSVPTQAASHSSTHRLLIVNTDDATILHDTGDHQENRHRTDLLIGSVGCLRRALIQAHVVWEDESNITMAALTDLLR